MLDTTIEMKDAGGHPLGRRVRDDGAGGITPYVASDVQLPSGKAPVTAAGEVFTPIAGRAFNITISGGIFAAQVERRFGGTGDWFVVIPDSMRSALPPSFPLTEGEVGVQYRVTVLSGTPTVRISQ
jgi:hypothetical protein